MASIETVNNSDLTDDDMIDIITSSVEHAGLGGHNITAFNDLLDRGIPEILINMFRISTTVKNHRDQTEMDRLRESVVIEFHFYDVKIGTPVYATYPIGKIMPLYPNEARLSGRTYAAPITLSAEVTLTAKYSDGNTDTKKVNIPPFMVASIPIMVGSNRCHTWNLTREARKALCEDPNEAGGYFIAKGGEWVVDWLENIRFNTLHIHKQMLQNERVRGEYISQPDGAFENSSQIIVRYMVNGSITIEINSTKLSRTKIPFFILFRLLGMASDADILEQIVYDPTSDSPVVKHMVDVVGRAIQHEDPSYAAIHSELDREALTRFMAVRLASYVTNTSSFQANDAAIQYLNKNLLDVMDRYLLPHLGIKQDSRIIKLRFLGMIIHKTLLVDMDILEPTDRDSYSNKRVHGAGVSIAKAFKTQFNNSVVVPVLTALRREIRNTPFEELTEAGIANTFKNPMNAADLSRTLEQAITSGNSTLVVRRNVVKNRVSSGALERKNMANVISALNGVGTNNTGSKQTDRADRMRRVHASFPGYICVAKSADTGANVGLNKERASTATICSAGEPYPLIVRLEDDPLVIKAANVYTPDLIRKKLAVIYVNGIWIGCTSKPYDLVSKYRQLRRKGEGVDPQTTIAWNPVTDDIDFCLDVGRLIRPMLIVDNNLEEYNNYRRSVFKGEKVKPVTFVQNVRITKNHIDQLRAGKMTLDDLRKEGIIEWITPLEAENCLAATSLSVLQAAKNDVTNRYTHCDIEQSIYGLTALISPFGNHTQPARVTYETNQGRQACGWYSFAAPFRIDKNRFFQHYCEVPLVRTLAYNWLYPNGMNTIVAYMINKGFNQEDSALIKSAFAQRGGFAGAFYTYEKAELEKGEFFTNPDLTSTKNLKPNASYEKLVDGFVQPGTVINQGDVIIGRVATITKPNDAEGNIKYIDRSIVYREIEPATVTKVMCPRGPNDNIFGIVVLKHNRPFSVGDKMSSRAGNKSIVSIKVASSDLPYDPETGISPDIIINPHAIPSRMTIGQMLETSFGLRCQKEGVISDGTSFRKVSVDEISKELEDIGLRYNGLSRLFNGQTGEHYDAAIFIGPTFHQRLQKFAVGEQYAVGDSGPTDALTGQPLEGKSSNGGLRIGEMEAWVLQSHGAMMTLSEKMFADSDGKKQIICRTCGLPAIHNSQLNIYKCNTCGEGADIGLIDSCQASMVFQHELRSANVKVTLGTKPREFEIYKTD